MGTPALARAVSASFHPSLRPRRGERSLGGQKRRGDEGGSREGRGERRVGEKGKEREGEGCEGREEG